MRKKYYVMNRGISYTVSASPELKFWGEWSIIAGPMPKKKAYSRMYTEREAVERNLSV